MSNRLIDSGQLAVAFGKKVVHVGAAVRVLFMDPPSRRGVEAALAFRAALPRALTLWLEELLGAPRLAASSTSSREAHASQPGAAASGASTRSAESTSSGKGVVLKSSKSGLGAEAQASKRVKK